MKPLIIVFAMALAEISNTGVAQAGMCSFVEDNDPSAVKPPLEVFGDSLTLKKLLRPAAGGFSKSLEGSGFAAQLGLHLWDVAKEFCDHPPSWW